MKEAGGEDALCLNAYSVTALSIHWVKAFLEVLLFGTLGILGCPQVWPGLESSALFVQICALRREWGKQSEVCACEAFLFPFLCLFVETSSV